MVDILEIKEGKIISYPYGNGGVKTVYLNKNGDIHREDGPAISYPSFDCEWWLNGKLHRLDGPAVYNPLKLDSGDYYIDGVKYTKEEFKLKKRLLTITKILKNG